MDQKLITMCTGLGGCYCSICTVSEALAKNIHHVRDKWFKMDRSIGQLEALYMKLCDTDEFGHEYIGSVACTFNLILPENIFLSIFFS